MRGELPCQSDRDDSSLIYCFRSDTRTHYEVYHAGEAFGRFQVTQVHLPFEACNYAIFSLNIFHSFLSCTTASRIVQDAR